MNSLNIKTKIYFDLNLRFYLPISSLHCSFSYLKKKVQAKWFNIKTNVSPDFVFLYF